MFRPPRWLFAGIAITGAFMLTNSERILPQVPVTWNGLGILAVIIGGLALIAKSRYSSVSY